jgi:hypothetical protein
MWPQSVRATHLERARVLPGDELIPEPIGTLMHAITIRRPAREVSPWLAQMGAGNRAGWYSYDIIDNGRRRSAARIVIMQRRQLLGIACRAESRHSTGSNTTRSEAA